MIYMIRWTLESEYTFLQNLEYLAKEWNGKVISNFLDRVDLVLQNIARNPLLYPLHESSDIVRRCPINKNIVLYYRIADNNTVDLVTFWNNYRDPQTLTF